MPIAASLTRVGGVTVVLTLCLFAPATGTASADDGGSTSSATSQSDTQAHAAPDDVKHAVAADSSKATATSTGATTTTDTATTATQTTPKRPKSSKRDRQPSASPKVTVRDSTRTDDSSDTAIRRALVSDAPTHRPTPAPPPTRTTAGATVTHAPVASAILTRAAVAEPSPPPPNRVGVVRTLLTGVVDAILSPFASNRPTGEPAATPMVWSLMAFARREFESLLPHRSTPPAPIVPTSVPEQRTLILSAFPAEADVILARTTLDPNPTVVVDGHHFYLGTMSGKKVIVAMTGIGMVNATETTQIALDHFTPSSGISVGAVVFSGVAGGSGRTQIGSVAVPARWTSDDGATWHAVDADMLAAANGLSVDLEHTAPLGDPFCACNPLARLPLIDLRREPQLFVGGDGSSDDNNNGTAFPAIPFGGDIFGPQPCTAPDRSILFTGNFFQAVVPFLANGLISNLTGLLAPSAPPVDAVDQETAAAQQVAEAHGIPFLGIRGMSDGSGDPLRLPGYPFTFVVYRQLAADNAAIVTQAFLQEWDAPS
jgi:nucleoside phosphorylase